MNASGRGIGRAIPFPVEAASGEDGGVEPRVDQTRGEIPTSSLQVIEFVGAQMRGWHFLTVARKDVTPAISERWGNGPKARTLSLLEFNHDHFEWLVAEVLFNVFGRTTPNDVAGGGLQDF